MKTPGLFGFPAGVWTWFDQASLGAPEDKIPLPAIHLAGEIWGSDLVILRRSDYEDPIGRLQTVEPEPETVAATGV